MTNRLEKRFFLLSTATALGTIHCRHHIDDVSWGTWRQQLGARWERAGSELGSPLQPVHSASTVQRLPVRMRHAVMS